MQTIRVVEKTGKDGDLTLRIPIGHPDTEYEVLVVLQAKTTEPTDDLGWPTNFFDKTFGSIDDDTFFRHSQGELPPPVELD